MNIPDYRAPATLEAALNIKQEYGAAARVIAGGTDLILRIRNNVFSAKLLLDLQRVSLDTISGNTDEMSLGASVTQSQILANAEIATLFPALVEACRQFAGPPIRNRGTVGGNLVNASPAADLVTPLMAYDANIVLATSSSVRVLPLMKFFTGPGQTVIAPDEILTAVKLPLMPPYTAATFIKLGQRRSMAISIVNLTTRLTLAETGVVSDARIALGSLAPTPIRAIKAETILIGNALSDQLVDQAAKQARQETSPINDVRATRSYRLKMAEVLVRRALMASWDDLGRHLAND